MVNTNWIFKVVHCKNREICVIKKRAYRLIPGMDLHDFQKQVYPLRDKLFRFAKRLLENTEEAEDAVQEVFIKLWNKRTTLDEYRSLEALAMVTTRNFCLDKIKVRRFPVERMDDHRQFLESLPGKSSADHSDLVFGIHQAMKSLPEQQKMVIHLRDVEGYELSEIAAMLEMNENAVRVNLSRARKRIREIVINTKIYEYQRN